MIRNSLFVLAGLVVLAGFFAPATEAAPDPDQLIREIHELQALQERAQHEGNWHRFIRIQKRIADLCEHLERKLHDGVRPPHEKMDRPPCPGHEDGRGPCHGGEGFHGRRTDRPGRGERGAWRDRAVEILRQVGERFLALRRRAREERNHRAARDLENAGGTLKDLGEFLLHASAPELREKLFPAMREGVEKLERQMREARERGEGERAEMLAWILDRAREFAETVERGLGEREARRPGRGPEERREGPPGEGLDRALGILHEVHEEMEGWFHEAREAGFPDAAHGIREGMEHIEAFVNALRRAHGPEEMAWLLEALGEGLGDLKREVAEAKEAGDRERAKMTGWVLERLHKVFRILDEGLHRPREGDRPGPHPGEGMERFPRALEEMRGEIDALRREVKELEALVRHLLERMERRR